MIYMHIFKAFLIAFSMYSRIPVPQRFIEWNDKNMKYSICFFPLVGAVIGLLLVLWYKLCGLLGFGEILFAAVAASVPVFVTGGIHLDGFCDTTDALASYQPTERKLEILKDPNAGAFAVIKTCVYVLLYFAFLTHASYAAVLVLSVGFVLSRALSGLAVINFRSAKGSGLAASFAEKAHKRAVTVTLVIYVLLCAAAMVFLSGIFSAAAALCMAALCAAAAVFIYYRIMAYRQFGGITGDIAGYFLSLCEIWMCVSVVIMEGVLKIWN